MGKANCSNVFITDFSEASTLSPDKTPKEKIEKVSTGSIPPPPVSNRHRATNGRSALLNVLTYAAAGRRCDNHCAPGSEQVCCTSVSVPPGSCCVYEECVSSEEMEVDGVVRSLNECAINDSSANSSAVQYDNLTQRVSYEEMIHTEEDRTKVPEFTITLSNKSKIVRIGNIESLECCLIIVTQWVVQLQDIFDDRFSAASPLPKQIKCSCSKAILFRERCLDLRKAFFNVMDVFDELAPGAIIPMKDGVVEDLTSKLRDMQHTLRCNVSISITDIGAANRRKTREVMDCIKDVRQYIQNLIDLLSTLIYELFHVPHCKDHTIRDSDLRIVRANEPATEDSEVDELSDAVDMMITDDPEGRGRKRKQVFTVRKSPPTTPVTESPSKRPRRIRPIPSTSPRPTTPPRPENVMSMLEDKRKTLNTNSLYQFVLWKENYKNERERTVRKLSLPCFN